MEKALPLFYLQDYGKYDYNTKICYWNKDTVLFANQINKIFNI